jgi:RHH-type proline utilization regulon transcriptional repressor/proline dehydrogenase/delta 1-pyrroline-5-carboxylate dehydrogenase
MAGAKSAELDTIRQRMRAATLADETELVRELARNAELAAPKRKAISGQAAEFVRAVRASGKVGIMESFLAEYGLSTKEGVALMCLAEAMLRVPDALTVDELIKDKITPHDWAAHIGDSGSIFVNASTWGLMLTGRILDEEGEGVAGVLHGLVRRLGEPVIRRAVGQAMAEMGSQFVLGRTIEEAMSRGQSMEAKGYSYSYDMLGEAARTDTDARKYLEAYARAISAIGSRATHGDVRRNPGISVKLSALHPRYEMSQRDKMLPVLADRLLVLARAAKSAGIGFNIDAEEAERLDLSLDVVARVLSDSSLAGWDRFGVVVQAYGRRAMHVIEWLASLAESLDRRIMVRLVKGAYWDAEIKRAQVLGLAGFPVFTRKTHTDIAYLACARRLLAMADRIYPQFATHNAHSAAAVLHMAEGKTESFEFQRLHGMGEALHEAVRAKAGARCRIYAPVGAHRDLLAYLVRRLLENGANSSFVNQIVNLDIEPEEIAHDPIAIAEASDFAPSPAIPPPSAIFAPRRNSAGFDLTDPVDLARIEAGRKPFAGQHRWQAVPILASGRSEGTHRPVRNPAKPDEIVGEVTEANAVLVADAIAAAREAQPDWERRGVHRRAEVLRRIADLYEGNAFEFFALAAREAGKNLADCVAEVREAVDFLRYYAQEAERLASDARARGVIACISPWNFPLAIFTGQIAAALAAGNSVIAKPAEQTPLIAHRAVRLMLEAGVPEGAIQLLPGDGEAVGAPLTAHPAINGVCFTGSTEVARLIDRQLAKTAPEAMLIAETGGLNAMIVDSTALLEQAVRDVLRGAFQSAGQRCSALRMLYVQRDVEPQFLEMLEGAMDELTLGDPWQLSTDVGPVIDEDAHRQIDRYCETMAKAGKVVKRLQAPSSGFFVPPTVIRLSGIEELEREIFGPALHVASFEGERIGDIVRAINARGYGLTFALHTRIDLRVQRILDRIRVGNIYVNRDQIGAVVGSQPFGGEGLSGTGPKAGGRHYLPRFCAPRVEAIDLAPEGKPASAQLLLETIAKIPEAPPIPAPERIGKLRQALRGRAEQAVAAAAALDFGPVDLPGPTGESNQYFLFPRGTALCLGPDSDSLLAQAVQALAAGNRVLAVAPHGSSTLRPLRAGQFPIAAIDASFDPASVRSLPVDIVAYAGSGGTRQELRRALAERDGPIVALVAEKIAPVAYCTERSVCVDTTAAGGNATLLTEAGA